MSKERFLIDANSLITPHLTFYPFDFAKGFWDQLEQNIVNGNVAILDLVKNEVFKVEDRLRDWMDSIAIGELIDRRDITILFYYSAILQSINDNNCYTPSALAEWAKDSIADPWLIAAAKAKGFTIITFEKPNKGLNSRNPSKIAKIPDIASTFDVKTETLYYMMRVLGFKL